MTAHHLREVIGEGARRVREAAGVRQEDVSRSARIHGLAWNRSRVATLERGEKAISAEELVLVPLILSDACGRPVTLADLIPSDARIALSATLPAAGYAVLEILAGRVVENIPGTDLGPTLGARLGAAAFPDTRPEVARRRVASIAERAMAVHDRLGAFVADDDNITGIEYERLFEGDPSEAERAAAKRLGEDPHVVLGLSRLLWGRSLAEERDRLVDERADAGADPARLRALRGRVTRQLVEHLADEIERRGEGQRP